MTYPPVWRRIEASAPAVSLMRDHMFANMITAHAGLRSTKIPFVVDVEEGQPVRLRAHLNGQNPQLKDIEGQEALVSFSGRSCYISPHWRTNLDRAGTVDYEEVQVRGKVRLVDKLEYFMALINDLSAGFEPQFAEIGDYPTWHTSMAPDGYIERLFPAIRAFEIEITSVEMISKLHQAFSDEDRRSIADHLERSDKEDARAIAGKIRAALEPD